MASRLGEAARTHLASKQGGGHEIEVVEGGPRAEAAAIERAACSAGVMVVAGGDGSVHHAAAVAMKTGTPIYHLPCGNENLFAREFGMTGSVELLGRSIAEMRVERVDVGRFEAPGVSRHFVLMASFGTDASVVHRLDAVRKQATGHLAYVGPSTREFFRPHLPELTVVADGKTVVEGRRGLLIVANCRRYALRMDPCHRASMKDGRLDYIFMPCATSLGVVVWGVRCLRRVAERKGAVGGSALGIEVRAKEGGRAACQVDGEAGGWLEGVKRFRAEGGVVPVLVPASGR